MDTLETGKTPAIEKLDVAALIDNIKRNMPTVYDMIKVKASEIGNDAFAHVRAGLRGEVNRFYAFENGHVVGTRFNCPKITSDVAMYMVEFGVSARVIWAPVQAPANAAPEVLQGAV